MLCTQTLHSKAVFIMKMNKKRNSPHQLHRWELALMLALCISFCVGTWAQAAEQNLSEKLIRLHVIAESDSEEDQVLKLEVRDAVLTYMAPLLDGVKDTGTARKILTAEQDNLQRIAEETTEAAGMPCSVSVSLGTESYPTREYEDFALPAGSYLSLRIILGNGKGHNWWCVVYPPLCTTAVEKATELDPEDVQLITQADTKYAVKFRLLEWWGTFRQALER